MKYLWLTRFPPYPPLKGGALDYSRDLIRSLALVGEVTGLAYDPPHPVEDDGVAHWLIMRPPSAHFIGRLLSPLPNLAARNVDAAFLERAVELASSADALFVDFIAMAWLVEPLRKRLGRSSRSVPIIMVTHNHEGALRMQMAHAERKLIRRAALFFDGSRAARLERRANAAADGMTTITSADGEAFARECSTPSVTVSPAYCGPMIDRPIDANVPRIITILGNRTAYHKRLVLENTLQVLASCGVEKAVRIEIAGDGDFSSFQARFPGFHYAGYVADLSSYASGIRLGVLSDDVGGGFKMRALTYAFLSIPMLALDDAMGGMGFERDVHYIGADTLEELAGKLVSSVDDIDKLERIRAAALAMTTKQFSLPVAGQRLAGFAASLGEH